MPDQWKKKEAYKDRIKKNKFTIRLQGKFILITIVTIILSIGAHTFLNLVNFVSIYKESVIERVFAQTLDMRLVINELLESGLPLNELDGINRLCIKMLNSFPHTRYCVIIDNFGKILYKHDRNFPDALLDDSIIQKIIKSGENLLLKFRHNHELLYDFSFPLTNPVNDKKTGSIRIGIPAEIIDKELSKLVNNNILSGAFFILVAALIVFYLVHFSIIKMIRKLLEGMRKFGDGDLTSRVIIKYKDEIGDIAASFNRMADKFLSLFEERKSTLKNMEEINVQLKETRDELWGEMHLARKIQTILLPEKPEIPGFEIAAHMIPMEMVGGDYYDIITVENSHWIIIGDVSGHGVTAGLVMMMAQTAIHTVLNQNLPLSPRELLSIINKTLKYNIKKLKEIKYMTITVIACLGQGQFAFSGLHLPILLYHSAEKKVEVIDTRGMWIGILNDINHINKIDTFNMLPEDVMLLYTDGIVEARDGNDRIFSMEKLIDCFKANGSYSVNTIKDSILAELEKYTLDDDVSLLIIKRE